MAVIQVSTIQIRQGFLQDLGQLAAGEFGWANDRLRLFIGNGTIEQGAPYPGNTEILTQYSEIASFFELYSYKGLVGGYEVITGASQLYPVKRTYQDKIDDTVNVLDFGAKGDGSTDDSDAIQRAIDEIYNRLSTSIPERTRRIINFHPGVYIVNGEFRIPPWCTLQGAGKGSVVLRQVGNSPTCVFKTTNSVGNSDAFMLSGGVLPGNIEFRNIRFETTIDIPVARLESLQRALFYRCQFVGNVTAFGVDSGVSGVEIRSSYRASRDIKFVQCDFSNFYTAARITETINTRDIHFDQCTFNTLNRGITANTIFGGNTVQNIRVTNSVFDMIRAEAILTDTNVRGTVSSVNTYLANVGKYFGSSVVTSVVDFGGNNSYSWSDVFTRTAEDDYLVSTIRHRTENTISVDTNAGQQLGQSYTTLGRSTIMTNSSVNYIPVSPRHQEGMISYRLERGTRTRFGQVRYATNVSANTCNWHDSFTEDTDVGIDMTVQWNSANARPEIVCTVDNSSNNPVLTFDVKSFQ